MKFVELNMLAGYSLVYIRSETGNKTVKPKSKDYMYTLWSNH